MILGEGKTMKKQYEQPKYQVTVISLADILTESGAGEILNWADGVESIKTL